MKLLLYFFQSEQLKEVLNLTGSLNDEQRQNVTQLTDTLLEALNSSVLPGDLTVATNFIQYLARYACCSQRMIMMYTKEVHKY